MPLRHTIWSLILTALVLANVLSMPLVRLGYELNKSYIAENLCVNRDKPIMLCNGQCYLQENLKKATQESKGQTDFKVKSISFEYLGAATAFVAAVYPQATAACYGTYTPGAYNAYTSQILQPPQV